MPEADAVGPGSGAWVQCRNLNINPWDVEDALDGTEEGAMGVTVALGFDAACRFRLTHS